MCTERIDERIHILIERINQLKQGVHVIAIDGRCASGKTTMANRLGELFHAGVIHMDDFFLPLHIRTDERLHTPGGNVHYERFCDEVLPNLNSTAGFSYRKFDCHKMEYADSVEVTGGSLYFVEGAYSCHPALGEYMSLRVFSDVDKDTQRHRIVQRGGKDVLSAFENKWIPMEEAYFQTFQIEKRARIIL